MENKQNRSRWIDKWSFDTWARGYDSAIKNMETDELKLFEKYDYVIDMVVARIGASTDASVGTSTDALTDTLIGASTDVSTNTSTDPSINTTADICIAEKNPLKLLDIGCGTGNLYGRLKSTCEFVGMDQSVEMLIQSKAKYPEMNLRLGNFLDKPFIENDFDIVVSTYAFHHLTQLEKEKAMNLMLSYLAPKGRIIIADLMFLNENEREKQRDYFYSQNRQDLWDIIEDEYYSDLEKLANYAELLGCLVTYKHLANFTWLLEIEKQL